MPSLTDLKNPHADQEFIDRAMIEEASNHKNLIASSRDELFCVLVNAVMINRTAIAQEVQYHAEIEGIDMVLSQENIFRGYYSRLLTVLIIVLLAQAAVCQPV